MSTISTHVLDTARGGPVAAMGLTLAQQRDGTWVNIAAARTDDDGRAGNLAPDGLDPGTYRLRFATGDFFAEHGIQAFYPEVYVVFTVAGGAEHYHVPLLISPYGYSTYRGS